MRNHSRSSGFAFKEEPRTGVYSCSHVKEGAPILYVTHDREGDWQFLCGRIHDPSEGVLLCLADVVARDPSLNSLAGLHHHHRAERQSTSHPWKLIDEADERIARHIEETGWSVQLIPEGKSEAEPAFAYTIGLFHQYEHPELILFGMSLEDMHVVLNDCARLVKKGRRLRPGQKLGDILAEGYELLLREVKAPQSYKEHVGYAIAFYKGLNFPLLQVLWPDARKRFPGEPGASEISGRHQPLLP
ncbi:DUF4262 domain-containing protein [Vitiosangium sp. GDMCC 1.1324]|uniref:DUF4262 domain-containing protein n=1 Tax=Vitiosangium sp. (strain GDMCC 1.1324) TaxID=2138576 RepID=UPI000D381771|nr:DUF4262 domain-containing protein [Vitiosangium sp. GDMCC 1.1324]PTL82282.1 hypothetical protein DAT35_21075 [Vitiosangium sp. GDMCC 1.1324]